MFVSYLFKKKQKSSAETDTILHTVFPNNEKLLNSSSTERNVNGND